VAVGLEVNAYVKGLCFMVQVLHTCSSTDAARGVKALNLNLDLNLNPKALAS
jgi:hypothetical protein